MFDRVLERGGPGLVHTGAAQRGREPAGDMTGRLAESGGQRPRGDNRSDARQHDRDGGQHVARQLTQPRGRPRILDVDARRGIHLPGQQRVFVVIPADDGDSIAGDARLVQGARAGGGRGGCGKQSENERVRHCS